MPIKGSPVVKNVYLDEQGSEYLPEDMGGAYLDDSGNELKQFQIAAPPALQAAHAKNVAAEAEAYKPSWAETFRTQGVTGLGSEMLKGAGEAITKTPSRIMGTISAVPEFAKQVITNPTQAGVEMIKGTTEPLISPRTTGEALGATAIDAALTGGAVKAISKTARIPGAWKAKQASLASDRIVAGLGISPTNQRGINAVDKSLGTLRTFTNAKKPFSNLDNLSDFVERSSQRYFDKHHGSIAEINKSVKVMVDDEEFSMPSALNERARLNKRLHRYLEQDPKTQAIMEEVNPKLKDDVLRLDAFRDGINTALDTAAPQSASQAEIMRQYSHLKELSEISRARAKEVSAINRITRGSKEPAGAIAKDAAITLATFGFRGGGQIPARTLGLLRQTWQGPRVDPNKLIRRAGKKFRHIAPADEILPVPIPDTREELLKNFGGQIRFNPVPEPPSIYRGPERRRSPLDPAVLEENRRRSVQAGIERSERRRMSTGEAAMTPGATLSDESNLNFYGYPEAAKFFGNIERKKR
jgi:hypothetical protein